ncbi:hypothetical protein Hanom_Chr09g00770971 [Helianthus anomalus]
MFRPEASEIFKESVQQLEVKFHLALANLFPSYPYRSPSGDSEETFSEVADVSKEASLEGSTVGGDGGLKLKKAKKAKKGKSDGSGASKPSAGV